MPYMKEFGKLMDEIEDFIFGVETTVNDLDVFDFYGVDPESMTVYLSKRKTYLTIYGSGKNKAELCNNSKETHELTKKNYKKVIEEVLTEYDIALNTQKATDKLKQEEEIMTKDETRRKLWTDVYFTIISNQPTRPSFHNKAEELANKAVKSFNAAFPDFPGQNKLTSK